MAAVNEGPIPFNLFGMEKEQASLFSSSSSPTDGIIFAGICLIIGLACRRLLRGSKVPYTVALLVLGIGLGFLEHGLGHRMGTLGDGIRLWANIDADLLLATFLPVLLFEGSFLMEVHQVKRCMAQMLLVAGPGVLISTFCIGAAVKLSLPYGWSWEISLLLGAILSATDPVAVVASMKELGVSKKISTIIEGESMMNDGVSMVVYQLFFQMVFGQSFGWVGVVKFFTLGSVGSVATGIAFGMATVFWLGFVYNDTITNFSLTFAVSYIAYFVAQEVFKVSGILTVVTLGIFLAAVAKTKFKANQYHSLEEFWGVIAYIYNTLIFILSGIIIADGILRVYNLTVNKGLSWGHLFLLYAFVQVARAIVVAVLYPLLRSFGYGLNWKEATLIAWSGLRGAVSLSLALAVRSGSTGSVYLSSETGILFVFFTGGVVFLTIVVNGSTTQLLLYLFGMDGLSAVEASMLDYTKSKLLKKAYEVHENLAADDLRPADWPTTKSYMMCINNLEDEGTHYTVVPVFNENLKSDNIVALRVRLLKATQATYCKMFDEGRITEAAAKALMQSADRAMDLASRGPLSDWNCLSRHVNFPKYFKYLRTTFPENLVRYLVLEKLQFACYICSAFTYAHKKARKQLLEFVGANEITQLLTNESEEEENNSRMFLEDINASFPQVSSVVKMRQVTFSVLNGLSDYLQIVENDGLLEEKVALRLQSLIQIDLEKILKTPPKLETPKIGDVLNDHPCLRNLPSNAREELQGSAMEIVKLPGEMIYSQGSNANGMWLVLNGLVKQGKLLDSEDISRSTYSQGSILGLYEVLVGKPYICGMVADSVVLCLYLKTETLTSLLKSIQGIERFFWQESAIFIAQFMLPRVFQNMPTHELRTQFAESLAMTIHLERETLEIPQGSACLLLEGSLRPDHRQTELISSPAVLLPPHPIQNLPNPQISDALAKSISHRWSCYIVEEKARVVILNFSERQADSVSSSS